ncbi:hypothetical protein [Streptomyces anulatus]|uniref:hypothetical protein n=1 Tax=Streptomyces anulatus TaxID=1892 RepID=UPI0037A36214
MAFARGDPRNAHGPSNAKLFVRLYRDRFRHVEGLGWYSWDGYRWKRAGAKMASWEAGEMAEEIPDIAPARPVQRPGTPSTGAGCSSSCPTTANRTGRRLPARCPRRSCRPPGPSSPTVSAARLGCRIPAFPRLHERRARDRGLVAADHRA